MSANVSVSDPFHEHKLLEMSSIGRAWNPLTAA